MNAHRFLLLAAVTAMALFEAASAQDQPRPNSQVNPPRVSQAAPQRSIQQADSTVEQRRARQAAEQAVLDRTLAQADAGTRQADQDPASRSASDSDASTRSQPQSRTRTFIRTSDLIGMRVLGDGDAELGTVQDVFIDPLTFGVQYVVLDTDPDMTTSGQLPILPWALFQTGAGSSVSQGFLTVPLSLERLERAPTISTTDPELRDSAAWVNQVDAFFEEELREVRVARPDFGSDAPDQVNDRDSLPIGRRPITPGTPGVESNERPNPNGVFDRGRPNRTNRGAAPNSNNTPRTPSGSSDRNSAVPESSNPAGNSPATGNSPGNADPPQNLPAPIPGIGDIPRTRNAPNGARAP